MSTGIHAEITFTAKHRRIYMEQIGHEVVLNLRHEQHDAISIVLSPFEARLVGGWLADLACAADREQGSKEAVLDSPPPKES